MAWLTRSASPGGWKVTVGLSSVGPPPLTSSSQVPANCSTTVVPPYSRYSSAPRTSIQKSRDRAGSVTTRMWVTATSGPSGPGDCSFAIILPAPNRPDRPPRPADLSTPPQLGHSAADLVAAAEDDLDVGRSAAESASALWVDFDGHQAVTVSMDYLPEAVLSPVDRRRSQPHFLRLTVHMPSEPLKLDCETERIVEAGDEVLGAPGLVVERPGCCGQERAHIVNTDLVTANPSHERNVVSV